MQCRDCGEEYTHLGKHLRGSCDYPKLTDKDIEMLSGALMGDGTLNRSSKNPSVRLFNTKWAFLDWFIKELDYPGYGPDVCRKATENWKTLYKVETLSAPTLNQFDWYGTGQKRFPDMKLTPMIAKIWYAGDGSLNRGVANIGICNEIDRPGFIEELIPFDVRIGQAKVWLAGQEESRRFFEWMGQAPPGMGYKWL